MMNKIVLFCVLFCVTVFFLAPRPTFAAPRPELYPNKHYKSVGPTRSRRDTINCQVQAEDYLGSRAYVSRSDTARATTRTAARGAALGALAGAIKKDNVGRSMGAGAAVGGLSGVMNNRRQAGQATPEYKNFVEACLEDMGYKVIRWN